LGDVMSINFAEAHGEESWCETLMSGETCTANTSRLHYPGFS
jgi:hypothetical protein